ncbi:ParB/RepB/Spo0J family partition protein [Gehongia tenuis]|uniref:ParB/RepB/Spo0J family partition protein n=1 Tax=Gehongia tenuis TaxID=2763655 RepID=A0A926D5Z3_9FIRM|nr:ParB/RepB/Spo0J family partition protein [Gehongia tenuis]MBC8532057.1 ParB/RepB/Spo0J family partition protein [Gehongia tenuis]
MRIPLVREAVKEDGRILLLPVDSVWPNPYQPRRTFSDEALFELSQSIRQLGLLQPITVRQVGIHAYELIAGERRLRAAKLAGLREIPAQVIKAYEGESALMALVENLQRENLSYMEEALGYQSLIKEHNLTQEEVARQVGKSQSTVANKLRILRLPKAVKDELNASGLSERHARALLRLPDEESQLSALRKAVKGHLTVQKLEALVEDELQEKTPAKPKRRIFMVYKDHRLFVNTMKNAVREMNAQGIRAEYSQKRLDDQLEIKVIIPLM